MPPLVLEPPHAAVTVPPTRLGPFVVHGLLGEGGMGRVYLAEDCQLGRKVAVKVLRPEVARQPTTRGRFLREARAAAAIRHDHVVPIYQVGEHDGLPFLAMPLLDGEPLDRRLERERVLPPAEVVRIGRETALGLEAVHAHGLVHRDVKPSNLWLEAPAGRVKVLDFGLAVGGDEAATLTLSGVVVGTPAYMSPEQARAEAVDARSDLFSLGCVLYRMSTGLMPFRGGTAAAALAARISGTPPAPREVNPGVPGDLSDLIMRLLGKDPEGRPASAREVHQALAAVAAGPAGGPPVRRKRWAAAGVLLAAVGVAAAGVIYVTTDTGSLAIETADESVKVVVERGGEDVAVVDTRTGKEVRLASGEYRLRLGDDRKDVEISPGAITLKRGDRTIATVRKLPAKADPPPPAAPKAVAPPVKGPDPDWEAAVAAQPADRQVEAVRGEMRKRNPAFDGKLLARVDAGVVTGLEFPADDVTDLGPVRALKGLTSLQCPGSRPGKSRLADLSPLKGLPLEVLSCGNTEVSDLTPLTGMPLTYLGCENTRVADLSPLARSRELLHFDCSGSQVSDLRPLKDQRLHICGVNHTKVADLSALTGMPIDRLYCEATAVSDLSPLKGLPLSFLALGGSAGVSDLSPLKGLPLKWLGCPMTGVSDLSPLKGLPLSFLDCQSTKVADLSPLRDCPLTDLTCPNTGVRDFSPLAGVPLKTLVCDFRPARDAAALRGIATLQKINNRPVGEIWKELDAEPPARRP